LRGHAQLSTEPGLVEEYLLAQRRYYGDAQAEVNLEPLREASVSMGRIVLRPSWVGLLDFQTRLPRPMMEAFG
jgi:hypothetical protein